MWMIPLKHPLIHSLCWSVKASQTFTRRHPYSSTTQQGCLPPPINVDSSSQSFNLSLINLLTTNFFLHHITAVTMKLPIHFNRSPLGRLASVGFGPLVVRFLTLVNIILLITITCLDLTAFITRSIPVPILSGQLTDNGKIVCSVNLALTFGPRLPWNCIDGFHAYSTQEGRQVSFLSFPKKQSQKGRAGREGERRRGKERTLDMESSD